MSRLSYAAAAILQTIASGSRYGFDIMAATGLPSGTVYPALRRMEKYEQIRGRWESEEEARRAGRPKRRYYEITASGIEALESALNRFHSLRSLDLRSSEA
ncbi:MAG: PadR family transcriptional regulator [Thermoanaerobaculia bacterium]|nr:PadR family transcriptional regulator [Thermoanaerobaculia bacterium]